MAGRKCKCERCGAVGCWNQISADVFLDYEAEFRIRRKDGKKINLCKDCLIDFMHDFSESVFCGGVDDYKIVLKERKW